MYPESSPDSDYMTYSEYMKRLRQDLGDPDFSILDGCAPHNEEEYQTMLAIFQQITKKEND